MKDSINGKTPMSMSDVYFMRLLNQERPDEVNTERIFSHCPPHTDVLNRTQRCVNYVKWFSAKMI